MLSSNYELRLPLASGSFYDLWVDQSKWVTPLALKIDTLRRNRISIIQWRRGAVSVISRVFPVMVRTLRGGGATISPVKEQLSAEVIIVGNEDPWKEVTNTIATSCQNEYCDLVFPTHASFHGVIYIYVLRLILKFILYINLGNSLSFSCMLSYYMACGK